jgi:hypothetical protein
MKPLTEDQRIAGPLSIQYRHRKSQIFILIAEGIRTHYLSIRASEEIS